MSALRKVATSAVWMQCAANWEIMAKNLARLVCVGGTEGGGGGSGG